MTATLFAPNRHEKEHETKRAEPTVFVIDDDADVRNSITLLVRSVGLNVKSYPTCRDFLDDYCADDFGCLVLDVRMPMMSGLELQAELACLEIEIPIIMISAHGEIPVAIQAMRAGALDFIQKPFSRQTLLDRIHQAVEIDRKNSVARRRRTELSALEQKLSDREREVMNLLVKGKTTKHIARDLNISPKTVDNHRSKVLEKMEVDSVPELILLELAAGGE